MRVLLVSGSEVFGGAEVYLASLAIWLRRSGVDCVVVCCPSLRAHPRFSGLLGDRDREAGDALFGPRGSWTYMKFLWYLRSIGSPMVVHLNLTAPVSRGMLFMPLIGRLGRAPVVVATEHLPRITCRPAARALKCLLNHCVDLTISVSEAGKRHLTRYFWLKESKVRVVHNGVVIPGDSDRLGARGRLGIEESTVMILQVASLERRKGQGVLLSALRRLVEKGLPPEVLVFFVGGGPDARWLRDEVGRLNLSAWVRLVGHQEIIADYYAAADVFVLPSEKESFPLSILEAMSFGLPVIASDVDGIPEQVSHGESGFLVEVGDVESLAGFLDKLVRGPDLRVAFGERGRQIVMERFSLERCFQETLGLWQEAVLRSHHGG